MLRLEFSEPDQQALNYERSHHPPPRVQQRMEALWLKSQGLPHHQIARLGRISGNPLRAYLKHYPAGGVEALRHWSFHRPRVPCRGIVKPSKHTARTPSPDPQ